MAKIGVRKAFYARPTGVPVSFAGGDWHFLFSFRVIDELQSRYPGRSIFDVVNAARDDTLDGLLKLIDVTDVLCDGQIPREEIPKFIVIATAKFHFSEGEAWEMTPRKFSLLNDAYRVVNGLKKEEEYASLLSLP